MNTRTMAERIWLAVIPVAMMVSLLLPSLAWSEEPPAVAIETSSPQRLSVTVGKSIILKSQTPMKRVSVGSMEIADVLILSPQQISITGKALGVTNVTLWKKDDEVASVVDVEVFPDISRLKETFDQLLPEEKNILVSATHDSITLSGTVSNAGSASKALALAEPYFPKKVVNLMKVASPPVAVELIKGGQVEELKFDSSE